MAFEPINYEAGQTASQDFLRSLQGGLQLGSGIQGLQQQQQAQQLAQQQAQQYAQDVQSAMSNPTPQAFSALSLKYPQQREAVKQAWDGMSAADQKSEGDTMAQAYSALLAGKPDVAKQVVQAQIDARKNSGLDTSHYDNALSLLDADPKQAQGALGFALSHITDPKTFAATFGALQELPGKVAEGEATAAGKQADNMLKNLGIVGQTAGALAKPGVKPEQAIAMFKSLEARGIIPKGGAQDYIDSMPTDPKALPDYLAGIRDIGIKPEEQKKFTTPDANAKLQSDTQIKTTGMNNATQLAVQAAINKRNEDKGDAEPTLDPDTLTTMAQQYLAGDKSVMQNLGRGAQGAANIVALRQAITKEAKAAGMTGPQIAAKMADYQGLTAGMRTSANISARVENAISEAKELAPLAIEAGRQVSRSGFLPFGKAQIMFDTQTNDPALKKFATANNGLVSAYAGAMARGQKPTVSDYDHARQILSAAQSQSAYEATVNQMFAEMAAASRAPQNVRSHLRDQIGGSAHSTPAATADHPADISALLKKYGSR
jgi:hypothetical protein